MLNHAMGSRRFCIASMKTSCVSGLSERCMAGRTRKEILARLPIQVTVASKCSQYVSANAQAGGAEIMAAQVSSEFRLVFPSGELRLSALQWSVLLSFR